MRSAEGPLDVLVVGANRAGIARSLGDGGLLVDHRPGVFPAIALLRRQGARVVVLGHEELRGRNVELIDEIREIGGDPRILLLSPESAQEDRERLQNAGVDENLVEPVFPQILMRCVRALMTNADNGREVLGRVPSAGPRPEEILRQIHRAARDLPLLRTILVQNLGLLMMARRTSLMLHRPSSRALFLAEASGLPEDVQMGQRAKIGRGIAGRVAERARPVVVSDIEDSEFRGLARPSGYRTGSFLCVPLVADARVLGVISFADRQDGRPYAPGDLEAILPLVDTAAAVIRNALLIRRLRGASMLDALTGLYNRRFFDRARRKELKRAIRYTHPLSLLLMDADDFKHINDRAGHPAGDEALRALSAVLRGVFRETDIICRYGGDEFAVLMPETDSARARQAVERLENTLQTTPIPGESGVPGGKLRVSCGLATFPEDTDTPENLVSRADERLYEHKRSRPGGRADPSSPPD